MATPISGGTYRLSGPETNCPQRVTVTFNSDFRNGEADVTVLDTSSGQKTKLSQWIGQDSASNGVKTLEADRTRDGWISISSDREKCTYEPEVPTRGPSAPAT